MQNWILAATILTVLLLGANSLIMVGKSALGDSVDDRAIFDWLPGTPAGDYIKQTENIGGSGFDTRTQIEVSTLDSSSEDRIPIIGDIIAIGTNILKFLDALLFGFVYVVQDIGAPDVVVFVLGVIFSAIELLGVAGFLMLLGGSITGGFNL